MVSMTRERSIPFSLLTASMTLRNSDCILFFLPRRRLPFCPARLAAGLSFTTRLAAGLWCYALFARLRLLRPAPGRLLELELEVRLLDLLEDDSDRLAALDGNGNGGLVGLLQATEEGPAFAAGSLRANSNLLTQYPAKMLD